LAERIQGSEVPVPAHSPVESEGLSYLPLPFWGPNGMETANEPHKVAAVLQILAVLTLITLAPSLLIMLTCFTRVLIVMGFVRRALATNTLPPDQIMVGLSLFLTFFIMYPTWQTTWNDGLRPYFNGEEVEIVQGEGRRRMSQPEALQRTLAPTRAFMFACLEQNEAHDELYFFMGLANRRITPDTEGTLTRADIPTHVLIPAFMTAELRRAFWMGFLLYLPFLILDMAISSILMSMGMMMLPPVMISLPFKIVLFVMVDGWRLLMEGIVTSFPDSVLGMMIEDPPAAIPPDPIHPVG
jgi:flagellar biosynthetic protein FliP